MDEEAEVDGWMRKKRWMDGWKKSGKIEKEEDRQCGREKVEKRKGTRREKKLEKDKTQKKPGGEKRRKIEIRTEIEG